MVLQGWSKYKISLAKNIKYEVFGKNGEIFGIIAFIDYLKLLDPKTEVMHDNGIADEVGDDEVESL